MTTLTLPWVVAAAGGGGRAWLSSLAPVWAARAPGWRMAGGSARQSCGTGSSVSWARNDQVFTTTGKESKENSFGKRANTEEPRKRFSGLLLGSIKFRGGTVTGYILWARNGARL